MKKLNIYEINDGIDGVILAKSIKQAVKMLIKYYEPYKVHDLMFSIKKCKENWRYDGSWALTGVYKKPKKGRYRRPKVLGWRE